MDYAEMRSTRATELVKDKCITVIRFQKSAIDLVAEVARLNVILLKMFEFSTIDYMARYANACYAIQEGSAFAKVYKDGHRIRVLELAFAKRKKRQLRPHAFGLRVCNCVTRS
uniref:Uncharacterized protein n=1 Tax=Nicotiana tabacum TaxID=4097 RepID=A0A1S4DKU6_TOBAC|nr:PREDICTED: uncharacterized protein LOC107830776 [Nicotiana tabacum]